MSTPTAPTSVPCFSRPPGLAGPPSRRRSSSPTCRSSTRTTTCGIRPGLALPAGRAAGRPQQRPQHRRDRLLQCRVDAPRRRPGGAAAGRRDRVRQRHRGDERQRRLRPDARLRRHRRPRRSARWARASRRCWRRTSGPAAAASAASATSPPGTRTRDPQPRQRRRRAGLLADAELPRGLRRSWRRSGLSFDAWLYHPQLPELTALARAFPDDADRAQPRRRHRSAIGAVRGRRDEVFADWSASIRELASCPNVHVKLGGMGMRLNGFGFHEQPAPPSSEALAAAWRPYVETCIEAFGADALHVREQLPGRQGLLQLRGATGTPASGWRRARARRRRRRCSAAARRGSIDLCCLRTDNDCSNQQRAMRSE